VPGGGRGCEFQATHSLLWQYQQPCGGPPKALQGGLLEAAAQRPLRLLSGFPPVAVDPSRAEGPADLGLGLTVSASWGREGSHVLE
jgi:hypothetical protein